jgi:glucose/arabinose dehydrogenase
MNFSTARRRTGYESVWRVLALAVGLAALTAPLRAATYPAGSGFSDYAVVTGLDQPTDFVFLPNGRMLILEKPGRVMITTPDFSGVTVALDHRALVDDGFEKGFLGICLHPTFSTTGFIYIYYTTNTPKNQISRFTLVGDSISAASEVPILQNISAENGNHNGGTVLIGPDGKLWAAPGDSGTGGTKAQNLSPFPYEGAFSGKILRMELDGSPAAGNPYIGDATKEQRIFAYGFRNPFRFSFRPTNGSIYLGDVGQSSREELDVGVSGGNFGWPYREGKIVQPGGPGACPVSTTCIDPVFDYDRTVGTTITGGIFVTGNAYPPFLQGKYLFGDYGPDWIRYLEFDSNDQLVGTLQNFASSAEGPVAFHQGPDGYVYYAAINTGRIYRIVYATRLNTVEPCRVLDTRDPPGPWGLPALAAGTDRTFVIAGRCGIPAGARAVAANLTATLAAADGNLIVFPQGAAPPLTSAINFRAGQTRANNAVLMLGPGGDIVVRCSMPSGSVHLIVDVTGWFQ